MLLIGLLDLVTIRPGHDWGGDFAQYIHHAENLATGMPYGNTGYIYCSSYPSLGPRQYPPGFPLLLAPACMLFGLSMAAFKIEIIAFLLLTLPPLLLLFRDDLPFKYRVTAILLFAMNPYVVNFKNSVMSDLPFLFFLLCSIVLTEVCYRKGRLGVRPALLFAALFFCCYLLRTVGVVLIPALPAYDFFRNKRPSRFALMAGGLSVLLVLLSRVFLRSDISYLDQFIGWETEDLFTALNYYFIHLDVLWSDVLGIPYTGRAMFLLTTPVVITGAVAKVRRRVSFYEFFLCFYLTTLLIFPSNARRFLLPVAPFYFLCLIVGILRIGEVIGSEHRQQVFAGIVAGMIAVSYSSGLGRAIVLSDKTPDGPYSRDATELFTYVKEDTDAEAVFAFRKPRVLALYTGRSATAYPKDATAEEILEHFDSVGVTHVIVKLTEERDLQYLVPMIAGRPESFSELFRNDSFVVYSYCEMRHAADCNE